MKSEVAIRERLETKKNDKLRIQNYASKYTFATPMQRELVSAISELEWVLSNGKIKIEKEIIERLNELENNKVLRYNASSTTLQRELISAINELEWILDDEKINKVKFIDKDGIINYKLEYLRLKAMYDEVKKELEQNYESEARTKDILKNFDIVSFKKEILKECENVISSSIGEFKEDLLQDLKLMIYEQVKSEVKRIPIKIKK